MKDKDEQTALIGMAIGAAVISLVATQKQINQGSIVDELVRLGRQKGDGVEAVQPQRQQRRGIFSVPLADHPDLQGDRSSR